MCDFKIEKKTTPPLPFSSHFLLFFSFPSFVPIVFMSSQYGNKSRFEQGSLHLERTLHILQSSFLFFLPHAFTLFLFHWKSLLLNGFRLLSLAFFFFWLRERLFEVPLFFNFFYFIPWEPFFQSVVCEGINAWFFVTFIHKKIIFSHFFIFIFLVEKRIFEKVTFLFRQAVEEKSQSVFRSNLRNW